MSAIPAVMEEIERTTVASIEMAEDITVPVLSVVSEQTAKVTPQAPPVPLLRAFPTPGEVTEAFFGILEGGLRATKRMSLRLADAVSPLTERILARGEKDNVSRSKRSEQKVSTAA